MTKHSSIILMLSSVLRNLLLSTKSMSEILCLIFLTTQLGKAQDPPKQDIDINQLIQSILPIPTEDTDNTDLYEALIELYHNPIPLNTATYDEFASIYVLSAIQIASILEYRSRAGPFLSKYELQAIPELDLPTIYKLSPFITLLQVAPKLKATLKSPTQHFLFIRASTLLETQKGFSPLDTNTRSNTRYVGSPIYSYLRYRYARTGAFSFGLNMEKDSGEKWWYWKPSRQVFGADFTSFHGQIQNRGKLKNLIIGDYQLQIGQGVALGTGFSFGKGSEVIRTTYRSTTGIRPYTSSIEANYFRGIAGTYYLSNQIEFTCFFSKIKRDGHPTTVAEENGPSVSSLPVSGYHRTPSERLKQNTIREQNMGIHLLFSPLKKHAQIGLTGLHTLYNVHLQKKDDAHNLFEFSGKHNFLVSIHADYRWRNLHFFSEGAQSKSNGKAIVAGLIAGLGKQMDFTVLARHYDRLFHSFYGNSFAESSRPINENGYYFGLRYMPIHRFQISLFHDFFKFPWLKYQISSPSQGHQNYVHLLWKPNKKVQISALMQVKHKSHNFTTTNQSSIFVSPTIRRTAMIHIDYKKPMKYTLRSRIQWGSFQYENQPVSTGIVLLQDITYHFQRWELSGRMAYFKSDNYDSRQYVYEKDVLYAFSIPAYYDTGTRHYLMIRYVANKHVKIWIRWSQTRYKDMGKISSGLNEISGNKRSEFKTQVMYQF
jgi:hypothetical protein